MQSVGIDLVDMSRIAGLLERYHGRFEDRILSADERRLLAGQVDKIAFVAGRFAAKEAAIKALGRYLSDRPAWHELAIINDGSGMPCLTWSDRLKSRLSSVRALVSIAHERTHAIAIVLLTEKE